MSSLSSVELERIKQFYEKHKSCLDGPHTGEIDFRYLPIINNIIQITQPKRILEIGFNRGSSALQWLLLSSAHLTSIDIVRKPKSLDYLHLIFGDRFSFYEMNSAHIAKIDLWYSYFDLIFIDGGHTWAQIAEDMTNAVKLNPRFIAIDDWFHRDHMQDLRTVVGDTGRMVLLKEFGVDGNGQALFLLLPK